jgi:hypothetical protein
MRRKRLYRRVTVRVHDTSGEVLTRKVGELVRYINGEVSVRFNGEFVHQYKLAAADGPQENAVVQMYKSGLKAYTDSETGQVVSIAGLWS